MSRTNGQGVLDFLVELLRLLKAWVGGQLLIAFCLTVLYGAGFAALDVPLWLLLAPVCGLFHLVPIIGGVFGLLIPVAAVLIAGGGATKILWIVGVYIAIQTFESFYLTPKILGSRLSLRPAVVFLALLLGSLMFGFLGALVAVPAVAAATLAWKIFQRR